MREGANEKNVKIGENRDVFTHKRTFLKNSNPSGRQLIMLPLYLVYFIRKTLCFVYINFFIQNKKSFVSSFIVTFKPYLDKVQTQ